MKKRFIAMFLTAALVLSMTACANNSKEELKKITFVLDWTPNTNHTGLYVAQEKGYFAEEGLEVEIVQPPEDGAEVLVASGKAQFGIACQDTMAAGLVESNLPIKSVAALVQHNTSGIISREGEGMDTPKGMAGKKYATWDIPVEQAMIKDVVEKDGGDFSKINLIPSTVTDEVSALQAKSVDAIWIFYAWTGIAAEVAGLDCDFFEFSELNPVFDYYTPTIISSDDYLKENPEEAKAFLRATAKGYEDAIKDPTAAADILVKAVPELDKELVAASQEYLADKYKAEVAQWGYIDPVRWNAFYNWLNENKLVDKEIPENTGFTNEYLSK